MNAIATIRIREDNPVARNIQGNVDLKYYEKRARYLRSAAFWQALSWLARRFRREPTLGTGTCPG